MLAGVCASPGCVTGPVRLVRSEADLSRVQTGDVIVCPSTHSTWSVVLARAGALVTDHGWILSHPSIVAREFGIPAVVGTAHATSTLSDGQMVTVNGATGRVDVQRRSASGR